MTLSLHLEYSTNEDGLKMKSDNFQYFCIKSYVAGGNPLESQRRGDSNKYQHHILLRTDGNLDEKNKNTTVILSAVKAL